MKPEWCVKPSPCDYDVGSAYCPHRECRKNLVERHDNFLVKLRAIGDNYTKRGLIKRLTAGLKG